LKGISYCRDVWLNSLSVGGHIELREPEYGRRLLWFNKCAFKAANIHLINSKG